MRCIAVCEKTIGVTRNEVLPGSAQDVICLKRLTRQPGVIRPEDDLELDDRALDSVGITPLPLDIGNQCICRQGEVVKGREERPKRIWRILGGEPTEWRLRWLNVDRY